MKQRFAFILAGISFIGLGIWGAAQAEPPATRAATLAGRQLELELAQTPKEQERGLAGRCELSDSQGMLFVYNEPTTPTFWMKGMRIPIDIVWLRDGIVVGVSEHLPADKGKTTYPAPEPVDQVIELRAGWVADHGLKPGDTIEIPEEI